MDDKTKVEEKEEGYMETDILKDEPSTVDVEPKETSVVEDEKAEQPDNKNNEESSGIEELDIPQGTDNVGEISDRKNDMGEISDNGHNNLDKLMDVVMKITVELGKTKLTLKQVLELQKGSIVELDRYAGDNVDIFVNNRMIAQGEVVVVDDKFGVRIVDLVTQKSETEPQQ